MGGDILQVLKVLVNGRSAAAILPKRVSIAAQQIFRPHQFDRREIRVFIELDANGFQCSDVVGGKWISATVIEFFEVEFVLNAHGIEADTVCILKTAEVGNGAARE